MVINFDERQHLRGGFFTRKSQRNIGQSVAVQWAAAFAFMPLLIFGPVYAAVTYNVFRWAGQLPKTAPSRGGSGPHPIYGPWAHLSNPQRLDQFIRFAWLTSVTNMQTQTGGDHAILLSQWKTKTEWLRRNDGLCNSP